MDRKKAIDIFKKKLIFIPINKDLHWSLCVVVNPGSIAISASGEVTQDDLLSCVIFLDSLSMHSKLKVRDTIWKWLNSEWKRLRPRNKQLELLKNESLRILTPEGWCIFLFLSRFIAFDRANMITLFSASSKQWIRLWCFRLPVCLFYFSTP